MKHDGVMKEQDSHGLHKLSTTTLVIAALGVVFGDIGTSPIYTLKECFSPHSPHHIDPTHAHILGVVSLVLWSLLLLVCVKYLIFILRADNKGEGGVLSLMALASHGMSETSKRRVVMTCSTASRHIVWRVFPAASSTSICAGENR